MILEKVSAKRSRKRHIFPHMEAEKQSDFGKHHIHKVLGKTYMLPQMGTEKQSDFGKGHSQRALEKAW